MGCKPKKIALSETDRLILEILTEYRFLRSSSLWALVKVRQGVDPFERWRTDPKYKGFTLKQYVKEEMRYLVGVRLALLVKHGHLEKPKQQKDYAYHLSAYHIYEISKGKTFNRRYGEDEHHRSKTLSHSIAITDTLADFELGCFLTGGLRFIPPREAMLQFSDEAMRRKNPCAFPARITNGNDTLALDVEPDIICGVEYSNERNPNGTLPKRWCLVENNCGTESHRRTTIKNKTHERELLTYQQLVKTQWYKKHWGMNSMLMCNVMHSQRRIDNAVVENRRISKDKGFNFALYSHLPKLGMKEQFIPTGSLITNDWQRATRSPINLSIF